MKESISVTSPNEDIIVNITVPEEGGIYYQVLNRGIELIKPSPLGLIFCGDDQLKKQYVLEGVEENSKNSHWTPLYWDRDRIPDIYNEKILTLCTRGSVGRYLVVAMRVYDEGLAFNYIIPEQEALKDFVIESELTGFRFPEGCYGYEEHGCEGEYHRVMVGDIKDDCERPLTIEYPQGGYASITEAGTNNYSRMLLSVKSKVDNELGVSLSGVVTGFTGYGDASSTEEAEWATGQVYGSTPFETPWRLVLVGDRPGDLMEHNYLLLNLNNPCAIENTAFIKPGKVIRSGLSTKAGKACVDFAVQRNLQYIEFDAGWYGPEYDNGSDATSVSVDPKKAGDLSHQEGLDLQAVIEYGNERHIGTILYVNRRSLETQLDALLPLYKSWGVRGLKFGFVTVGSQKWTQWLLEAVKKCAAYDLIVDIHDAYRPTGFSRTYPNLLTQEGIRGNEHMPTARHNTTLPFTRGVAGPGDYTICYYSERIQTTRAHQLALSVVMFSPLQFLYWYSSPWDYNGEAEIEFFDAVWTTWHETKVVAGSIGEYVVVARRKDKDWFLGCISNEEERSISLPLSFLDQQSFYKVKIYGDNSNGDSKAVVILTIERANYRTIVDIAMGPSGGAAIHISPSL